MNKNVLLVSHFSNLSGAPISLALLAKYLVGYGYNVWLSIPTHGQLETFLQQNQIPYLVTGTLTSWYHLRKLIKTHHIEIVHTNTIISAPGAFLARFMHKKLIWHIREDISCNPLMARLVEKISDRIIILSTSMVPYFNPVKVENKLRIIHNGVDLAFFTPSSPQQLQHLRIELGITPEDRVVAVVGTIEPRKGQLTFIDACKRLQKYPNVKFLIIGNPLPGQASYKRKLEKRAESLTPLHFIPARPDIPVLLQLVDVVCVPSLSEPFGRVVVEAMAAGKPVIGSNIGGIPEIIQDQRTGFLVSPSDPSALADKIACLLDSPGLARDMGRLGRLRVEEKFTIQAHVEQMVAVYEELLV